MGGQVPFARARARRIVSRLRASYTEADTALSHRSALELLVATILSAQCTDERVNQITPGLFAEYADAEAYARADRPKLEQRIRPTGFFRNKAASLIGLGQALVGRHDGRVPATLEELVELPGVGRKTANVVLGTWYGQAAITVDTHVNRLSNRLGWTDRKDPVKIEFELQHLLPRDDWTFASHALILHGRRVCKARKPNCEDCVLRSDCPFTSD
jgi:endonuclease-3